MNSESYIDVLDKGFIRLVDYMGHDARVVQAARVSLHQGEKTPEQDTRLLKRLRLDNHTTPFEHVVVTFHVKAPLFVFREWHRHRTWSYSELSGRYVELPHEYYVPEEFRAQSPTNKQSSFVPATPLPGALECYEKAMAVAFACYTLLLDSGVAREHARMVLPLATYSEMYATVDLHNLLHFIKLREAPNAQWEIQEYARALKELIRPIVPIVMEDVCF